MKLCPPVLLICLSAALLLVHPATQSRGLAQDQTSTPADQEKKAEALKVLQDMMKRMGHLDHKGIEMARQTFLKWRDEYVAEAAAK